MHINLKIRSLLPNNALLKLLVNSPFAFELQFDVMEDGTVGPTLGLSAGFPQGAAKTSKKLFAEGEPAAELMGTVESLGLADKRWRSIPEAAYSKLVNLDGETLVLYCLPKFLKLRMRGTQPLDAKYYLQACAVEL